MKRPAISTKLRFEIFKRDHFTCNYCGRTPKDNVILHIDHIIPVARGGGNELMNLVTACSECNFGKSDRLIEHVQGKESIDSITKEIKSELNKRRELEKQLLEYYKLKLHLEVSDPLVNFVNKVFKDEFGFTLTETGMKGFLPLYKQVAPDDFIDAINIAKDKFRVTTHIENPDACNSLYSYVCGILYNKNKEKNDPIYPQEMEIRNYYKFHPRKKGSSFYREWQIRPYIKKYGVNTVKQAIDDVFSGKGRKGGYFASVLDLLDQEHEN